ncbi:MULTISPECIES: hypothetical protein [Halorubrum]|uniref:hypothetical protein n=1 Tax=Halorubrum TaxID=56688 RepID=UPI0015D4E4DF|nr:hypothetical protein [Halorubrum persicum]
MVFVVGRQLTEPFDERLPVGSAGVSRHERPLNVFAVLVAVLTVAGGAEILEGFVLAGPAIAVVVILPGVLAVECFCCCILYRDQLLV